jgi:hypothetical protein
MQTTPCITPQVLPIHEPVVFTPAKNVRYTPEQVLKDICRSVDEPFKKVVSKSRKREYVLTRMIGCRIAKRVLGATLVEIGRAIGGRHYSTVINNLEVFQALYDVEDPKLIGLLDMYFKNSQLFTANDFR